jgi:hypothetical protein
MPLSTGQKTALIYLGDGGNKFLQNAVKFTPDYMASHSRRQYSSQPQQSSAMNFQHYISLKPFSTL